MRFLVYNILFPIFFVVSAPFYFLKMWRRGNWQTGFAQRFGNYDESLRPTSGKPLIWFHAVSVGEVGICAQLLRELSPKLPSYEFVVSTTTSPAWANSTADAARSPQNLLSDQISFSLCAKR